MNLFGMPSLPDLDEMTANFDAMREDITAIRGLLERLVEIEDSRA